MFTEGERELAIRCLEIYIGNYPTEKQYAASLILKMLFKERYRKLMAEVKEVTGYKVNNRYDSKVIAWAKKVKKIGKCYYCGATKKLVAHHIVPWEYSINGRTEVSNGMCLCEKCHKKVHNDREYIALIRGRRNE